MIDRYMNGIFRRAECNDIIELLCTGWLLCPVFIIALSAVYLWRIKHFTEILMNTVS